MGVEMLVGPSKEEETGWRKVWKGGLGSFTN